MGLTAQINEREGIIDDMDDNAKDNAARTPIKPAEKDTEQESTRETYPSVKQSEAESGDENGQPGTAPRLQQTREKNAAKANLFRQRTEKASLEYGGNSRIKKPSVLSRPFGCIREKMIKINQFIKGHYR
jgi:hypothetical protein